MSDEPTEEGTAADLKRQGFRITATGELTEENIAQAVLHGGRTNLIKLIVPPGPLEARAGRILYLPGACAPALFMGAEVEVDPEMDPRTWAVLV